MENIELGNISASSKTAQTQQKIQKTKKQIDNIKNTILEFVPQDAATKSKIERIAQELYDYADTHNGAVGQEGFTKLLKQITPENVVGIILKYNELFNSSTSLLADNESLIETILDETKSAHDDIRDALIGQGEGENLLRGVFTVLLDRAKQVGVCDKDIQSYRADFEDKLNKELKGVAFTRKADDLNDVVNVVIQSIQNHIKHNNEAVRANAPKQVVPAKQQQRNTIKTVVTRYNKAVNDFKQQLQKDGWAENVADAMKRTWGENYADAVRKDLKIARKDIDRLTAALKKGDAAFREAFLDIFKITYNPVNISAYESAEAMYISSSIAKINEDSFKDSFSVLLSKPELSDEYSTRSSTSMTSNITTTYKSATKEQVYKREFDKVAELFDASVKADKTGQFKLMGITDGKSYVEKAIESAGAKDKSIDEKYKVLRNIALEISKSLAAETKKTCGGRSIEAIQKQYENCYKAAFGLENDILKRVTDYNVSQQQGGGAVKGATVAIAAIGLGLLTSGGGTAAVAGGTGAAVAEGATATTAAVGALKGAATVAALSAGVEITDRFTSKEALDALRNEGVLAFLEKGAEITDWKQIAKASMVSGVMCLMFAGQSYAITNLTMKAATAAGMGTEAAGYTAAALSSAGFVATGLGTEYIFQGEITVQGATFTVIMALVSGVMQVKQVYKSARAAEAYKEQILLENVANARKALGFGEDEYITLEKAEKAYKEIARKHHPNSSARTGDGAMHDAIFVAAKNAIDVLRKNPTLLNAKVIPKTGNVIAPKQKQLTAKPSIENANSSAEVSSNPIDVAAVTTNPSKPIDAVSVTGTGGVAKAPAAEYVPIVPVENNLTNAEIINIYKGVEDINQLIAEYKHINGVQYPIHRSIVEDIIEERTGMDIDEALAANKQNEVSLRTESAQSAVTIPLNPSVGAIAASGFGPVADASVLSNQTGEDIQRTEAQTNPISSEIVPADDLNTNLLRELFGRPRSERKNVTAQELDEQLATVPEGKFREYVLSQIEFISTIPSSLFGTAQFCRNSLSALIAMDKIFNALVEKVKDPGLKGDIVRYYDGILTNDELTDFDRASRINNLINFVESKTMTKSQLFMDFVQQKHPDLYAELQKSPSEINNPRTRQIKEDFLKFQKYEDTIAECRMKPGTKEADELYEKYLEDEVVSDNKETDSRIKNLCRQINKQFGVKIFLPVYLKEAGVALKMVYAELARYQMHAEQNGAELKLPPTLDFFTSNVQFLKGSVGGTHNNSSDAVSINTLTVEMVKEALAHELTHCNDTKRFERFPEGINLAACEKEFEKAGLSGERFKYACTNPKEFVAVASEGDITKYSAEFKALLVSMGLPEFMLTMSKGFTPQELEANAIVDRILKDFGELGANAVVDRILKGFAELDESLESSYEADYKELMEGSDDLTTRGEIQQRVKRVIARMNKAISDGETLTLERLAAECDIRLDQLRSLIYRSGYEEIQEKIGMVIKTKKKNSEPVEQKVTKEKANKAKDAKQEQITIIPDEFGKLKTALESEKINGNPRFTPQVITEILTRIAQDPSNAPLILTEYFTIQTSFGDLIDAAAFKRAMVATLPDNLTGQTAQQTTPLVRQNAQPEEIEAAQQTTPPVQPQSTGADTGITPEEQTQVDRIRTVLERHYSRNEALSIQQIAEKTNISIDTVNKMVTEDRYGLNKVFISPIDFSNKQFSIRIKTAYEELISNDERFTLVNLAKKLGIEPVRISNFLTSENAEKFGLEAVLKDVVSEAQDIVNRIRAFLEKSYSEGKLVYPSDIAKGANISVQAANKMVTDKAYGLVGVYISRQEFQSNEFSTQIKTVLEEAISKNEKLSVEQLAERLGVDANKVKFYLRPENIKEAGIENLWNKVNSEQIQRTETTDDAQNQVSDNTPIYGTPAISPEVQARVNIIKSILDDAYNKNEKLSINQLLEKLQEQNVQIKYGNLAANYLNAPNDRYGLKYLWNQVKSIQSNSGSGKESPSEKMSTGNRVIKKDETGNTNEVGLTTEEQEQVESIRALLERFYAKEEPLSVQQIAQKLSISADVVNKFVTEEAYGLSNLYVEPADFISKQFADKIKSAYDDMVKNNEEFSLVKLAKKLGVEPAKITSFVTSENAEKFGLNNVLNKIVSETQGVTDKIREFLQKTYAEGKLVYPSEIAKASGINLQSANRIITDKAYGLIGVYISKQEFQSNEFVNRIKTVLEDAVSKNEKLSVVQLAEKLEVDPVKVKFYLRPENIEEAGIKELWNKVTTEQIQIAKPTEEVPNSTVQENTAEELQGDITTQNRPSSDVKEPDTWSLLGTHHNKKRLELLKEAEDTQKEVFEQAKIQIQELIDKVEPGSKMDEPFKITVGNNTISIFVNKTQYGTTSITVKNYLGELNSNNHALVESSLQYKLDDNGKLISARTKIDEFYPEDDVMIYTYSYEQQPDGQYIINSNKTYYQDITYVINNKPAWVKTEQYKPASEDLTSWECSSYEGMKPVEDRIDYSAEESSIKNMFFKLFVDKTGTNAETAKNTAQSGIKNSVNSAHIKTASSANTPVTDTPIITAKVQATIDKIKAFLKESYFQNKSVSVQDIADKAGIRPDLAREMITNEAYGLSEFYNPIDGFYKRNTAYKIKFILEEAAKNNEKVTPEILAEKLHVSTGKINHFLKPENAEKYGLKSYLDKINNKDNTLTQNEMQTGGNAQETSAGDVSVAATPKISPEIQMRVDKIRILLTDAISKGKTITAKEIAEQLGFDLNNVLSYLRADNNNRYGLTDLWNQVKMPKGVNIKGGVTPEVQEKVNRLKAALEEAITNKEKLTTSQLSERTGVSVVNIKTYVLPAHADKYGLTGLWNQVKSQEGLNEKGNTKTGVQVKIDKIKALLEDAVENGTKLTLRQVAAESGISLNNTKTYLSPTNAKKYGLLELWNQVKSQDGLNAKGSIHSEVQARIDVMRTMLEDAISKNKSLSLAQIADELGISEALTSRMFSYGPYGLGDLWNQVRAINQSARNVQGGQNAAQQVSKAQKFEFKKPNPDYTIEDIVYEPESVREALLQRGQRLIENLLRDLRENDQVKEPKVISIGESHFGFTIENMKNGNRLVTVKSWMGEKESWDVAALVEDGFRIEVDANGQMVNGKYFSGDNNSTEYSYTFERNKDGQSLMTYREEHYSYRDYRTSSAPTLSYTQEYTRSLFDSDYWVAKPYSEDGFDGKSWRFVEEEEPSCLAAYEFGYESNDVSLLNMFFDYARVDRADKIGVTPRTTEAKSKTPEEIIEEQNIQDGINYLDEQEAAARQAKAESDARNEEWVKAQRAKQEKEYEAMYLQAEREYAPAKFMAENQEALEAYSGDIKAIEEMEQTYVSQLTAEQQSLIATYKQLLQQVKYGYIKFDEIDEIITKLLKIKKDLDDASEKLDFDINLYTDEINNIQNTLNAEGIELDLTDFIPYGQTAEYLPNAKFIVETFEQSQDIKQAVSIIKYCIKHMDENGRLDVNRKNEYVISEYELDYPGLDSDSVNVDLINSIKKLIKDGKMSKESAIEYVANLRTLMQTKPLEEYTVTDFIKEFNMNDPMEQNIIKIFVETIYNKNYTKAIASNKNTSGTRSVAIAPSAKIGLYQDFSDFSLFIQKAIMFEDALTKTAAGKGQHGIKTMTDYEYLEALKIGGNQHIRMFATNEEGVFDVYLPDDGHLGKSKAYKQKYDAWESNLSKKYQQSLKKK